MAEEIQQIEMPKKSIFCVNTEEISTEWKDNEFLYILSFSFHDFSL